jgi:glycosyltransferase involved in cell wall biosynthesis
MPDRALRIAILGTRGLPPHYGGRETASDEIGRRLVARGHEVLVYCRTYNAPSPRPREYQGIRLVHLPSIQTKNLDTPFHLVLSLLHLLLFERPELVVLSGSGTSFAIPILHLFKKKTVMWVDGKAWTRGKWGRFAQWYLKRSARFGVKNSDAIVTDTPLAHRFYLEEMGRDTNYIPYGAQVEEVRGTETLDRLGLVPGEYVLFVGRLVPEKGVQYLIEAFERMKTARRLVIVGDDPYQKEFIQELKSTTDPRILFTGYLFGSGFHQLMSNCRLYVQPSEVEGTSPVLLTAMAYGRAVVVNGIPENLNTIGDTGLSFSPSDPRDLQSKLEEVLEDDARIEDLGRRAVQRVRLHYDWEPITDSFEALFESLVS